MRWNRIAAFVAASAVLLWHAPGHGDETVGEAGASEPSAERTAARVDAAPSTIEPEADDEEADETVSPLPDGFRPGSGYGWRTSPRTDQRTFHAGLDFLAPRGTPVRAVRDGVVERVARNRLGRTRFGGYGYAVVIRHDADEVWTFYAHLDTMDVGPGDEVHAGDPIGTVGNTTNGRFRSMATHLHFEVRHARQSGRSPFPGRYGRHNEDPREWLAHLGVAL